MATDDRYLKPHEMADHGMIDTLSMREFSPDQRMVDEALNVQQLSQQGGVGDNSVRSNSTMSAGGGQFGGSRSAVSPGF